MRSETREKGRSAHKAKVLHSARKYGYQPGGSATDYLDDLMVGPAAASTSAAETDYLDDLMAPAPQLAPQTPEEAGLGGAPEAGIAPMTRTPEYKMGADLSAADLQERITQAAPGIPQLTPEEALPAAESMARGAAFPVYPLEWAVKKARKHAIRPALEAIASPHTTKEEIDMAQHGIEFVAMLGLVPSYFKGIQWSIGAIPVEAKGPMPVTTTLISPVMKLNQIF